LHPNKIIYIVGDFNIDLLKNDCHNISTDFTNILYSQSFFPLIHLPTRVTKSSATLIDNIFCNHLTPHDSGVIVSDFSDHYPIFTTFKNIKTYSSDIIDNQKHNFSPNNIKNLQTFLESFNWEEILLISNVNEGFAKFNDILQNSINQFCPVQSIKAKKKKQPWMTSGLLISSIKKNKLYKKYISNPSSSNKNIYLKYKNMYTKIVKAAEKLYFLNEFSLNKSNLKKTWDLIKISLNKNNSFCKIILKDDDDNLITDSKIISNKLNEHFSSVSTINDTRHSNTDFKSFLGPSVPDSFFLIDTHESEILRIVECLKNLI